MVEKVFKIICNSRDCLTAEMISKALLEQITLNPKEPNVIFGVIELNGQYQNKIEEK